MNYSQKHIQLVFLSDKKKIKSKLVEPFGSYKATEQYTYPLIHKNPPQSVKAANVIDNIVETFKQLLACQNLI